MIASSDSAASGRLLRGWQNAGATRRWERQRMSNLTQLDARQLMELAVDVMRQSLPERRTDGKATPRVGAVIWRAGEDAVSACRGELREGDHAEYTLI